LRVLLSILSCLLFALLLQGQKTVFIAIYTGDFLNDNTEKLVGENLSFPDSNAVISHLENLRHKDFSNGYLYAHYSMIRPWSDVSPYVEYYRGNKVFIRSVTTGNADESMLRSIGYAERKIAKWESPDPERILEWENKIVSYYENNGYPFAGVAFQVDSIFQDSVNASWNVKTGPMITFDSIVMKGKYKPSGNFVSSWLNIDNGKPYDEKKIAASRQRLSISDLIEEEKPMQVHFSNGKAKIYLYLKKKKANQFDGILGFSPDAANPAKIVFNGDMNLKLANSFNHGDVIAMRWKSSANQSQEMNVKASVPFLFGLPMGLNGYLDIYRRDTTYVKTKQHYGVNFFTGIATEIEFFAENTENRVLDQSIFEAATVLPTWADSRTTAGGLRIYWPSVDQLIIPHTGFIAEVEASVGNKKMIVSSEAPPQLYDDVDMESVVWKSTGALSLFKPVLGSLHIMGSSRFGFTDASELFENDLFLIGGLQLMRGFDEKSLPVSAYSVSTAELRFFLEKFSYLALFADYGATRQMVNKQFQNKYYFSTGAGLTFSTKAGIFSLFYALGKQNPGDFSIRNGKVHFGFVTRF